MSNLCHYYIIISKFYWIHSFNCYKNNLFILSLSLSLHVIRMISNNKPMAIVALPANPWTSSHHLLLQGKPAVTSISLVAFFFSQWILVIFYEIMVLWILWGLFCWYGEFCVHENFVFSKYCHQTHHQANVWKIFS